MAVSCMVASKHFIDNTWHKGGKFFFFLIGYQVDTQFSCNVLLKPQLSEKSC